MNNTRNITLDAAMEMGTASLDECRAKAAACARAGIDKISKGLGG